MSSTDSLFQRTFQTLYMSSYKTNESLQSINIKLQNNLMNIIVDFYFHLKGASHFIQTIVLVFFCPVFKNSSTSAALSYLQSEQQVKIWK